MKKLTLSLLSLIFFIGILAGCVSESGGGSDDSGNSDGGDSGDSGSEEFSIAVVPKLVGIPYFNASEKGAERAGEELGVNVNYTGTTQADASQQVQEIENLISQDVDVIAVAPNDPASVDPVLKKAKDQGIHVMDWDTPANEVDLSVKQVDDEEFGRHMAQKLVEAMGTESGEIAILTGGLAAANLNAWIDAAKAEFDENYSGIEIVTEKIPTDEKQQVAYQKTLDLIKSYPDLKGVLAVSTPAPLGAAQAVQEEGLQDEISVVGSALPTDSKPFLEDGSLDTAVLWNPEELGYLTVALGKMLAEGEMPKDGQEIEGVGEISVVDDGKTVIMGPPQDFTKENAGDYNF
ncbi:simple sugar transport system substrate-binding protein/rhamnose transport system substrate-binding protein [Salinibacillus kushneri]|uniref:Simple sugar transport system substrate-binding protein/rhamnose transport system substrate-binding protein n=1 Tax=Salinibacillus kushneri TaxID=237682 RepID=A0A1H9YZS7_9BACI|nr:autoinducer 2 ABC transporter substrate-binding protein [Salinibacillus kushneri]SES74663.1 simple sugar transport system substrate-binding protein/rhamnose transport system substrate-binding protein [Salinibacillus kushneri]